MSLSAGAGPWNAADVELAEDYLERIGDGFDWCEGDQYGMAIVLRRALEEIARLTAALTSQSETCQ